MIFNFCENQHEVIFSNPGDLDQHLWKTTPGDLNQLLWKSTPGLIYRVQLHNLWWPITKLAHDDLLLQKSIAGQAFGIGLLSQLPHIYGILFWLLQYLNMSGLSGSVGWAIRLETRRSRVQPPPRSATFFPGYWWWNIFYSHSLPSADSRRAVVSFWRKNVHNTG